MIRKESVLVITHGSLSHVSALWKTMKMLHFRGLKVSVATNSRIAWVFQSCPFDVLQINADPFALGFDSIRSREFGRYVYLHNLFSRMNALLYEARKVRLQQITGEVKPSLILLDILCCTDIILLNKYVQESQAGIIIFSSKTSALRSKMNPPFSFYGIPKNALHDKWIWWKHNLIEKGKYFRDYMRFMSFDDRSVLSRRLAMRENTNLQNIFSYKDSVGLGIRGLPVLILSQREFEVSPFEPSKNIFYAGFSKLEVEAVKLFGKKALDCIGDVNNFTKTIYCSFGTLYYMELSRLKRFILILLQVARLLPKYIFIISFASPNFITKLTVPKNVEIFGFLDQYQVLKQADLCITHGGFNTIKECIMAGTPMVCLPLNMRWDQPGNSSKVAYHGLGVCAKIDRVNVGDLRDLIELCINSDSMLNVISKFKRNEGRYGKEDILPKILEMSMESMAIFC